MSGGALIPALLSAAIGFALGFAGVRARAGGLVLFAICAVAVGRAIPPGAPAEALRYAASATIIAAAAALWWPGGVPGAVALALAVVGGLLAGAVLSQLGAADAAALLRALPVALIAFPAAWLVRRGWGLGPRVAGSWLAAVAILAAVLPLVATPGYVEDHRG